MNKNRLFLVVFFVAASFSSMTFAGPWDWFKDKINSVWLTYKRWNTSYPRLISHQVMEVDGKKFEEFRYDLSQDTDLIKKIRRNVGIPGIYVSNDSDLDIYRKHIQFAPVPTQYIESGFDLKLDNSISRCMARWFSFVKAKYFASFLDKGKVDSDVSTIEAYTPILWELENSLPSTLDSDNDGENFIAVVERMLPNGAKERNALIGDYLDLWKTYTLRFKNNKGLMKAMERYPHPK